MKKFDKVLKDELEPKLGPSTRELRARCGIHSGSITAGVLRGQKARFQVSTKQTDLQVTQARDLRVDDDLTVDFRFQIFGDVVNTGTCN